MSQTLMNEWTSLPLANLIGRLPFTSCGREASCHAPAKRRRIDHA